MRPEHGEDACEQHRITTYEKHCRAHMQRVQRHQHAGRDQREAGRDAVRRYWAGVARERARQLPVGALPVGPASWRRCAARALLGGRLA